MPQLGIEPTTQACALIGNQTHDLLMYETALQPNSERYDPQLENAYGQNHGTGSHWPVSDKFLCKIFGYGVHNNFCFLLVNLCIFIH